MRLTSSKELIDFGDCEAICTVEYVATNIDSRYLATTFGSRSIADTTPGVQQQSTPNLLT